MFSKFADWLIARAERTPYFHLKNRDGTPYMDRFWLVPYAYVPDSKQPDGCGPVSFWRQPFTWLLQRFDIAARVHVIRSSDDTARGFHDHPWPYLTVILRGGYIEVTPQWKDGIYSGDRRRWYGPGSILFRPAQSFHRLEVVGMIGPATTLFITFKYRQRWGFMPQPERNKVYYRDAFK